MARKTPTIYNDHRPKGISKRAFEKVYWPYLPLVAVICLTLSFGGLGAHSISSAGSVLAYASSMSSSGLLSHTNQKRSDNGAPALTLNSKLAAAAQAKANDMASRNYWSHNTPEGNPPWIFVDAQGYSYQKIGENLAAGFANESATITGWMNSPAHKANMLDIAFKEVGFGYANNADYTSAGGGPMTIVVAFYGVSKTSVIPTPCPDGQVGTPPNCAEPPKQVASTTPPPAPKTPQPIEQPASPTPPPQPSDEQAGDDEKPVNNLNPVPAESKTQKTSQVQLVLGSSATIWATSAAFLVLLGAGALWITRHVVIARRALVTGENFVIHHPLIDIALMTIMAVAYLMTRTSGLIQ